MNNSLRFCAPLIIITLAGCSSDSQQEPPQLPEQAPLVFAQQSVQYMIDEPFQENSLSGGSGSGQLSWSVDDISIALIDADSGEVTFRDNGTVTVSVVKAGGDAYADAFGSYQITIDKYAREDLLYFEPGVLSPTTVDSALDNAVYVMPVRSEGIPAETTQNVQMSFNLPADATPLDPNSFNPNDTSTFNASTSVTVIDDAGNRQIMSFYMLRDATTEQNSWLMVSSVEQVFYSFANLDGSAVETATVPNTGDSNLVGFGTSLKGQNDTSNIAGVQAIRFNFSDDGELAALLSPDFQDYVSPDNTVTTPKLLLWQTDSTEPTDALTTIPQIAMHLNYHPDASPSLEPTSTGSSFEVNSLWSDGRTADTISEHLISYSTSDEAVATLNTDTNILTIIAPGVSTITATVAEDDKYLEGSISYELTVE